jgi:hypothetical protein
MHQGRGGSSGSAACVGASLFAGGTFDCDAPGLLQPGQATGLLGDADLLTVRYLRIFSSRFLPIPRIASRSSTLLKAPYDLRIWRIFLAVTGPIPGTSCSSSGASAVDVDGL